MFKVNNKNTRTTSMTFFIVNFEHISNITLSSVSTIDFKQVNVSWVSLFSKC